MIIILSPSKTQDFTKRDSKQYTLPLFTSHIYELIKYLSSLSVDTISNLMGISKQLAELNYNRYQQFAPTFDLNVAKQALYAFKGDVYKGIDIEHYNQKDIDFATEHLRIISGLYGYLRPLDLIQPYRLEMKTKLPGFRAKDLYEFWADNITNQINTELNSQANKALVNLASEEYFSAICLANIKGEVITPVFKDSKEGSLRVVGLFAKRARGEMANFIIKNKIDHYANLKDFTGLGYKFEPHLSSAKEYIFVR
jgi:cytoplasmic iron level regulating protein YaaA (DUF328/UPF0246 family)